jgi:hypothetical protein
MVREMQRYNVAQREIATMHGAAYVDLDNVVPKSLEYYFDDCHFTDKGSALVAETVDPAALAAILNRARRDRNLTLAVPL